MLLILTFSMFVGLYKQIEMNLKNNYEVALAQFPHHIDLEKVGDAIFNNEKYKVLKPTIHVIKDHFKDYILGKDRKMNGNGKIYLDDNGFRHKWYGRKTANIKSLRKADITDQNIELNKKAPHENSPNDKDINVENTYSVATTLRVNLMETSKIALAKTLRSKKPSDENRTESEVDKNVLRSNTKPKQLIKATFFCPYIGVISLATTVD